MARLLPEGPKLWLQPPSQPPPRRRIYWVGEPGMRNCVSKAPPHSWALFSLGSASLPCTPPPPEVGQLELSNLEDSVSLSPLSWALVMSCNSSTKTELFWCPSAWLLCLFLNWLRTKAGKTPHWTSLNKSFAIKDYYRKKSDKKTYIN